MKRILLHRQDFLPVEAISSCHPFFLYTEPYILLTRHFFNLFTAGCEVVALQ